MDINSSEERASFAEIEANFQKLRNLWGFLARSCSLEYQVSMYVKEEWGQVVIECPKHKVKGSYDSFLGKGSFTLSTPSVNINLVDPEFTVVIESLNKYVPSWYRKQ